MHFICLHLTYGFLQRDLVTLDYISKNSFDFGDHILMVKYYEKQILYSYYWYSNIIFKKHL